MAAGNGEVGAAECTPRWGTGPVEFFVADAAKELGVGGGTASGDGGDGAALGEEGAGIDGDLRSVHRYSRARGGQICPDWADEFVHIKGVNGQKAKKAGQICPA